MAGCLSKIPLFSRTAFGVGKVAEKQIEVIWLIAFFFAFCHCTSIERTMCCVFASSLIHMIFLLSIRRRSIAQCLEPKLEWLQAGLRLDAEAAKHVLLRYPSLAGASLEHNLKLKVRHSSMTRVGGPPRGGRKSGVSKVCAVQSGCSFCKRTLRTDIS